MVVMVVRFAVRLMRTRDAEHRWRRMVVPIAASIVTVATLTSISLFEMTRREQSRFNERMLPVDRSSTDPTDLWLVSGMDEVNGKQIPVYWVQPVDASARTVLPTGLSVLPDPPSAYVSLAADRLFGTELEVHQSLPDRVQIAPAGLRSAGELLMYRPVPATTDLSRHPFFMRVHATQQGKPGALPMLEIGERVSDTPEKILPASIGLLVIPAGVLMIVAISAASGVRDHRFGVLRALGASRAVLVLLAAFEVLFLWLPGVALGTAIWWFITQLVFTNRQFIPLINHRPIIGDLQIPASVLMPIIVALMFVVAVVAGIGAWIRFGRETTTVRPVLTANTISPWRLAPITLLAFGIAARIMVGGDGGAFLFLLTALIVLASLPLILPHAVKPIGSAIRRIPTIPTLLAGRGIEWDTIRSARPLLSFGVLVAIAFAVTGVRSIITSGRPCSDSSNVDGYASSPRQLLVFG